MSDESRIPTNLRTLLILETLASANEALSATELNQSIGLPKQTIHRLVSTLESEGFLIRDQGGKKLRPSRRLRDMATGLLNASQSHIIRHQILQRIAEETSETVNFVVSEVTGMNYLDRVETNWAFRIQLPIGSSVPFHCTASGKVFLSSLRKKDCKILVNSMRLDKYTDQTRTTAEELMADIKQCQKLGYAIDSEEFMVGMIAIAVPVLDAQGNFVGALATHGPSQRMSIEQAKERIPSLQKGANLLQKALFN
jgi:DNA-binding IclR family transcriptional regulator